MRRVLQNILLWIIALSILNTSIDAPDFMAHPVQSFSKDQFLEIESIVELLMDSIFDQSLPDQKGNDYPTALKKNIVIDFFLPEKKSKLTENYNFFRKQSFPYIYNDGALCPGFKSLFSPPPDTIA